MSQSENNQVVSMYEDSGTPKESFDSFTAASNGDLSYFTKYIVGSEENFSGPNKAGWTPIMYACTKGHALLVSYMVMCGVKTSCRTKSKVTPLMMAATSGDISTVESIFNPNDLECSDYRLWTALFYAVYFLQERTVEFLLCKGADVNKVDFQNETPLILAIKTGNERMVGLISRTATNLDVISYKNESAILLAKESSNPKIREIILNRRETLKTASQKTPKQCEQATPRKKKFLKINMENLQSLTPSPSKKSGKNRSFLGLKMSKSMSYSPNASAVSKSSSMTGSPCPENMSFWRMCVSKSPIPTNTHHDVERLLSSLGLEKYWPVFRDEEVDFETLLTFSEDNLKDIGITLFGPRKKIIAAIEQLRFHYT